MAYGRRNDMNKNKFTHIHRDKSARGIAEGEKEAGRRCSLRGKRSERMSGGGGGGLGGRGNGAASAGPIPVGSKKLVQSLKEIVNCPETEIYAMLRECNMDPNEAVHRLLSQDTFHEVKSKRDKKKEIREPSESRSRAVSNSSGRGPRGGTDRGSRSISSQSGLTDHGALKGKSMHKKENGTGAAPTLSAIESTAIASNPTKRSTVPSNTASMGNTTQATSYADGITTPLQSSSGFQNSWLGKPGQVSMADIVKMGRPQGKHPGLPGVASEWPYMPQNAAMSDMSHHITKQSPTTVLPRESDKKLNSFQESTCDAENNHDLGFAEGQQVSDDGWTLVDEQPTESVPTRPEISGASVAYSNPQELTPSSLVIEATNLHIDPQSKDNHDLEEKPLPSESRSTSVSERQIELDNSKDVSHLDEGLFLNTNSYKSQSLEFDGQEGSLSSEDYAAELSPATAKLRQLSLHEETSTKPIETTPAVIIPNHLRVTNADCAYLSFGSFGSGAFSGSFSSKPLESNLEVAPVIDDASEIDDSNARDHEYYGNGQLNPTLTENVASVSGTASENIDRPSASQPDVMTNDSLDATHGLQYNFPSATTYAVPSSTQTNATAYTYLQGNAQLQSLSPFSSLMQPNTLQNNILAASIPHLRDYELPLSPLLTTQSMPTRYSTSVSSISGPTVSVQEALRPAMFSNPQTAPQSLTSTTMLTSPALPQPLPVHHYSQPALPLGHFANMISYPILPQSYTYLPSMQQPFSANSPFHQSPAAVPGSGMKYSQPQYKSSLSMTSLPQASAIASAYGGFGSSSSIPGAFALNHTTASASTTMGFDEALSLQYKEGGHYLPIQQSENPAMWMHGAGSRTMSALPANNFYNYQQGQSQHGGFRQGQQPSQLSALGYSNLYHSQAGPSREHLQNPGEGNLNGSQKTQSQQTNQIWQHGY
ncbi:hypothetical protein Cni_G00229 [Canna indica]|uniref:GBF-interacting protein 1 N-terminal domain-containing protein n=1 Tax=Canna indica TaxID=4628 RepID=A0AAQ3PWV2_9LILI|nr:hypothetical protein Cni_G00229 [Canna indica]